jgi:hypothetical protein
MTVTFLRRFLSFLFAASLLIANISAEPQETSPEADVLAHEQQEAGAQPELSPAQLQQLQLIQALQAEFAEEEDALQAAFEALSASLSEEQQSLLGLLTQQYGPKMALVCINAETETEAFAACASKNGLSTEAAAELQQRLTSILAKENIPLEAVQGVMALQARGEDLQQRLQQRAAELQAGAPHKTPAKKSKKSVENAAQKKLEATKLHAQQYIRGMRCLKNILMYDPATDSAHFDAILETYNTQSQTPTTLAVLLENRTQIMAQLVALGLSPEQIKEVVRNDKKDIVTQLLGGRSRDEREMLFCNPETEPEIFKKLAKKRTDRLSEASDEHVEPIAVETIIKEQQNLIEALSQNGVSLVDALPIIDEINSEETSQNVKSFVAAASSSFLFGAADYCTQAATVGTQVAGSVWNWLLQPWGFYTQVTAPETETTSLFPQFTWLASKKIPRTNIAPLAFLSKPSTWSLFQYEKPKLDTVSGRFWVKKLKVTKELTTSSLLPEWVPGRIRNHKWFQYHKETSRGDGTKWVWSEAGFNAKALQALALAPTAYLFKGRQEDALLSQLPLPPQGIAELKAHPLYKGLAWPAAAIIPVAMGQHQELANQAFQSVAGAKGGRLLHLLFSKIMPLGGYATWYYKKNGLAFKSLASLRNLGMKDKNNAASFVARASMPVAEMVVGQHIDGLIRKVAPKNNVFLRTFLCDGWGSRSAHIASGALWRKLLHDQHHNPDEAFLKVSLNSLPVTDKTTMMYNDTPGISNKECHEITGKTSFNLKRDVHGNMVMMQFPEAAEAAPASAPAAFSVTSSRDAWQLYVKRSLAELAVKEGTVAATTAGLHALHSPVVRLGKKTGALISNLGKKVMDEDIHEGFGELVSSAQNGFKLLACLVKMVTDSTSNFKALVTLQPEKLFKMFGQLTKDTEQLKMYTKFAQTKIHQLLATQIYQYFLKHSMRSGFKKHTPGFGQYLKTKTAPKRNALWTFAKWTAFLSAYVAATTTLAEPITTGFNFDEVLKEFNDDQDQSEAEESAQDETKPQDSQAPVAA